MAKTRIITLSDIHISTNYPTNWYQKDFHEPYLIAIFDYIIQQADSIQELVLLGDIFDFWAYPPDVAYTKFTDILAANPNIFSPTGWLNKVVTALEGNVTYVNGNHDMPVTAADIAEMNTAFNYPIKYCPDLIYDVQTDNGQKFSFAHGHTFTLFNAPYLSSTISPIPIGYFITRAEAYWLRNEVLKPGQTVADLPDQGEPNGINLSGLVSSVERLIDTGNLVTSVMDYVIKITGIPENEPVFLPNNESIEIGQTKTIYNGLQSQWINHWGGGLDGVQATIKAAIADLSGTYIAWFAQQSALSRQSESMVLGHTHIPKLGLKNGLINYINDGFECPSSPDLSHKTFSFGNVNTDTGLAELYQVSQQNGSYAISAFSAPQDSVIASTSMDFSCYIIIDNSQGSSTLNLQNYHAGHGHYVVAPPQQILPGKIGKFWLQDYPGIHGADGNVSYHLDNGKTLQFKYDCPTGLFSNSCSGAKFYTSNDGENWGGLNQVKKKGHPFFVKFVL